MNIKLSSFINRLPHPQTTLEMKMDKATENTFEQSESLEMG